MGTTLPTKLRRVGDEIVERYGEQLEPDFEKVKAFLNELNLGVTKRMRNMIAGYVVRRLKKLRQ